MSTRQGIFITGTDTGVGKTVISSLLMRSLKKISTVKYFKPVQTGYLEDDDTGTVIKNAQLSQDQYVDPVYRLKAPQSPHRAARAEGLEISIPQIIKCAQEIKAEYVVVEGAGGLEVPIVDQLRMTDLARELSLPVLIVASTRLGTINHTLLSYQWAKLQGLNVLGVILSGVEDSGLQQILVDQGVDILFSVPVLETADDWNRVEKVVDQCVLQTLVPKIKSLKVSTDENQKDQDNIWHPFTQHQLVKVHPLVERGRGAHLFLKDGRSVIDGISSWWVNVLGHGQPQIAQAIAHQAHQLEHVIFAGFTHQPAIDLSEKILNQLNINYKKLKKVFFSDNGSTSIEVALKMAYQYFSLRGEKQRTKFVALRGGYHGDTLGAMSVGEPEGFHTFFKPLMMPVDYLHPDNFSELEEFANNASQYAACIVEPLVQGAGGMRMYSVAYLQKLAEICRVNGTLLICDEVFTGFYRTGHFLASDHAKIQPDIVCLSKGITGGFLPLAVTVVSQEIYQQFLGDQLQQAFLHGHSYTGNPIACAAANASFDLLNSPEVQRRISQIAQWTAEEISKLKGLEGISQPRYLGTIGAFDVEGYNGYFTGAFAKKFSQMCFEQGVLVKPLGGTVYTVPPYCISEDDFRKMYAVIVKNIKTLRTM